MNIKNTLTYQMVAEQAKESSLKLKNTIYVILSGNTLYQTLNKDGKVLCAYNCGNEIAF
jgi:hypothetical protein